MLPTPYKQQALSLYRAAHEAGWTQGTLQELLDRLAPMAILASLQTAQTSAEYDLDAFIRSELVNPVHLELLTWSEGHAIFVQTSGVGPPRSGAYQIAIRIALILQVFNGKGLDRSSKAPSPKYFAQMFEEYHHGVVPI